jgi:general secretion pathway protein A
MQSWNDQSSRLFADAAALRGSASASLTYEPFYGLREKPFSLSADPRFLFRSPAHAPAFDELQAGIRRREGLIVLTGEIGTGKTTLCRSVLQQLDRRTFASFVADPFVSREDLLKTLLVDFGVISIGDLTRGRFNGASRSDLSYPLYEFLDSLAPLQAFAVVVIDEAQNLSLPLLEEIRILSELERREKLLQLVLVGQPELRSSLRLPEMRQVDQRVSVRCDLTSLDQAGVAGYVSHRLRVAGQGESRVEFTTPALEAIYAGSSGVPRLINRICDRALQRAFASRSLLIDASLVRTAIGDLGLNTPADERETPRGTISTASRPPVVAEAPTPVEPQALVLPPDFTKPFEPEVSGLSEFVSEDSLSAAPAASGGQRRWLATAGAVLLAITGGIAAPAWYSLARAVDGQDLAAPLPPRPAHTLSQPSVPAPQLDKAVLQSLPAATAPPATTVVPPPRSASSTLTNGYSILVASFQNRDRAERLVEELLDAGYGARAVERSGGPTGRLLQVTIGGYTSAFDVQRDLQRIRELPGGYTDARIVEQD